MLRIMPKPFIFNNRKHENPRKAFNRIGMEWGSSFRKNGSQKKKQTFVRKEQNLPVDFYVWDKKFFWFLWGRGSSENSSFDSQGNNNFAWQISPNSVEGLCFSSSITALDYWVVEVVLHSSLQRSGLWLCLLQLLQHISQVILVDSVHGSCCIPPCVRHCRL